MTAPDASAARPDTPTRRLGRWTRHLARLLGGVVGHSVATRRYGLLLAVVLGLLLLALTATAQAVAPVALYPFA